MVMEKNEVLKTNKYTAKVTPEFFVQEYGEIYDTFFKYSFKAIFFTHYKLFKI